MSPKKEKPDSPTHVYASLLSAYGDAARQAPEPCVLRFKNPFKINSFDDINGKVEHKQLRAACSFYDGEDVPLDIRFSTDPQDWELSFAGTLEVWDIERDGQLAYRAFIYRGDSGSIFVHNTLECVSEVIQCHIHTDDKAFAEELRQALAWLPQDHPTGGWQLRGIQ